MLRFLTLLSFLIVTSVLHSQTGKLIGKVLDENGLSMPGATLSLNTQPLTGTISDNLGKFQFLNVKEGKYILSVSYLGYISLEAEVNISGGTTTEENFKLVESAILGEEVLILGDRLKGQAKALNQQKNNANITNIVAADQIGKFPDANIGDALKRISGITMQNDQGEARNIIIRGIAPQLNSVMLNGERVPSAEGDNRNVQLDLIPADMIQTIEVNKAILPNMDADAIGGAVNLVTRKAPNALRLSGTLGSGLNLLSEKPILNGSLIVGERVANDKLGIILSASYNNHNFGSDNYEAVWAQTTNAKYPVVLSGFDLRKYDVQRVRRSISLALDYELGKGHNIYFNTMYNWRDDWENRYRFRADRLNTPVTSGSFTEISDKLLQLTGRVAIQTKGGIDNGRNKARRLEDQRVTNNMLSGDHIFGSLIMRWSATLASALEDRPNERYITHRTNKLVLVDTKDPFKALVTLKNGADDLTLTLNEIYESNNNTNEQDFNSKVDFELPFKNKKGNVYFGGRLRNKQKERINSYDIYAPIIPLSSAGNNLGSLTYSKQNNRIFLNGDKYVPGNFVNNTFLGGLNLYDNSKFKKTDALSSYITSNFFATENIQATYLMSDYKLSDKLMIIAGLRVENTNINYKGFNFDDKTKKANESPEVSKSYLNVMPGAHLKYNFTDNSVLRLAWTNALARPNYYDIVPHATYSPDNFTLIQGNPDLEATTSSNVDLMFENYFKSIGLVSIGSFYKDLNNFIYTRTDINVTDAKYGQLRSRTQPQNGGTANVYGLEFSIQRQLDFLPGFLKGFGVYLNYTLTESGTTGIQGREKDDLRLTGTAKNMLNASLSYETKKLVLRASLNYASDYIDLIGSSSFDDVYYDKQLFLDVNASYAVSPKWRIYFEANNLTNQPLRYYQGIRERTFQEEYYNARLNLGIKFDIFGN